MMGRGGRWLMHVLNGFETPESVMAMPPKGGNHNSWTRQRRVRAGLACAAGLPRVVCEQGA